MPGKNTKWTRDEHLLAFSLYTELPFGQMHHRNPKVIQLAALIGRSTSSVALKLVNFARLDPALHARGIKGMTHGAKGEVEIWENFAHDPESLNFEAAKLRAYREGRDLEQEIVAEGPAAYGKDRESWVKTRVNQQWFRRRILSAYDFKCCVTGMNLTQLLVASHIVPWADDSTQRMNPRNGLCLNTLHDRAFDQGLMWIDDTQRIRFAKKTAILDQSPEPEANWLLRFEGRSLNNPKGFGPDPELLQRHRMKFDALIR